MQLAVSTNALVEVTNLNPFLLVLRAVECNLLYYCIHGKDLLEKKVSQTYQNNEGDFYAVKQ